MSKLLAIAFEPHEARSLAGLASTLGLPCDLLDISGQAPNDVGAGRVLRASGGDIPPADAIAASIAATAAGFSHLAAISSMQARDVLPRVAGILDAAMVTDVIAAESSTRFRRPVVAGSILATVEVLAEPVVLTVRSAGFPQISGQSAGAEEAFAMPVEAAARRVAKSPPRTGRPDLTQAKTIVSGGRPLRDAATFEQVIGGLADALGGAVGATRAAVDSGIAANDLQVGQTGKIVAPDLYIAAGISGSTQHMAGIKDSKVIVAINKDPDAPIFEFADFGLVADLFEAIPEIRQKLGR